MARIKNGTKRGRARRTVVRSFPKLRYFSTARVVIAGYIVIVAVLIVYIILQSIANNRHITTKNTFSTQNCSTKSPEQCELITSSAKLLDPTKVSELSKIADKIKELKGYETNPSLVYILLIYSTNLSDAENAGLYYKTLAKIFDPKVGYDQALGGGLSSMDELKANVDYLAKQQIYLKKNTWGITNDE